MCPVCLLVQAFYHAEDLSKKKSQICFHINLPLLILYIQNGNLKNNVNTFRTKGNKQKPKITFSERRLINKSLGLHFQNEG